MSLEKAIRHPYSPLTPDWRIQSFSTPYPGNETASVCTECRNKLIKFIPLDQWTFPDAYCSANHVSDAESSCAICFMVQLLSYMWPYMDLIDLRYQCDANLTMSTLEYSRETGELKNNRAHSIDRTEVSLHTESVDPSTIDFESLRQKLHLCLEDHIDCCENEEEEDVPGLRVIDCHTRKIDQVVPDTRYVALSYVWGNRGASGDVSETPLTEMPGTMEQTIEDALVVVLNMGYRYLWVDKYCIDQNDSESKKHQIRRMDSIYRNAAFTIIAAAGGDASYGLPGVTSRRGTRLRVPKTYCMIGNFLIRCGEDSPRVFGGPQSKLLRNSKWNTRGWTYQEGLLSRRCLVFTDEQVSFACRVISVDEGSESRPTTQMNLDYEDDGYRFTPCRGAGKDASRIWPRISAYSERRLTNPGDSLDAFSGILRAFQKHDPPVHHLWGVPVFPVVGIDRNRSELGDEKFNKISSNGFSMGLSWTMKGIVERRHGFPSWSWAGWTGKVSFKGNISDDAENSWRIIDALSDDEPSFRVYVELEDQTKISRSDLGSSSSPESSSDPGSSPDCRFCCDRSRNFSSTSPRYHRDDSSSGWSYFRQLGIAWQRLRRRRGRRSSTPCKTSCPFHPPAARPVEKLSWVDLEEKGYLTWADLEDRGCLISDHNSLSQYLWLDTWELQVRVYWRPSEQDSHANKTKLFATRQEDYGETRGTPLDWSCPQFANHVMKAGSVIATVISLGTINTWYSTGVIIESVEDQDGVKGHPHFEFRASLSFDMLFSFNDYTDTDILKQYISRRLVRLG